MLDVKPGDVVRVRGMGYAENYIRTYVITRRTAKYIFATLKTGGVEYKFDGGGTVLPRDKYINYYIFEINGVVMEY